MLVAMGLAVQPDVQLFREPRDPSVPSHLDQRRHGDLVTLAQGRHDGTARSLGVDVLHIFEILDHLATKGFLCNAGDGPADEPVAAQPQGLGRREPHDRERTDQYLAIFLELGALLSLTLLNLLLWHITPVNES